MGTLDIVDWIGSRRTEPEDPPRWEPERATKVMGVGAKKATGSPLDESSLPSAAKELEVIRVWPLMYHASWHRPSKGCELRWRGPETATMGEVRDAVDRELARVGILKSARLVAKKSTGDIPCQDNQPLGDRRSLFFVGESSEVSLTLEVAEPPVAAPSLEMALNLLSDLREGFEQESFQRRLEVLFAAFPTYSAKFLKKRLLLCLTVQNVVLPRYGFAGNSSGVNAMVMALDSFAENIVFARACQEICGLIGMAPSAATTKDKFMSSQDEEEVLDWVSDWVSV